MKKAITIILKFILAILAVVLAIGVYCGKVDYDHLMKCEEPEFAKKVKDNMDISSPAIYQGLGYSIKAWGDLKTESERAFVHQCEFLIFDKIIYAATIELGP